MAEGIAVAVITEAVLALVSHLGEVRSSLKHNTTASADILNLEHSLYENLTRLRKLLPVDVNGAAIDALLAKLKEASEFVVNHQRKGSFKRLWSARQTKDKLDELRKDLDDAFQMALLLTTLDVTLDAGRKNERFQDQMLGIYERHASDDKQSKVELRRTLGALAQKIDPIDSKLQSLVDMVKEMNENVHQTSEMEKFVADILANLSLESRGESSGDEIPGEFLDPIMLDLMCDPVKATDGHTYNRWSIINLTRSPLNPGLRRPFGIACDDFSLRTRLFEKFPSALAEFHERRRSYKEEALKLAAKGHDAEALVRVNNVLLWDEDDVECQRVKDLLDSAHQDSHRPGAPHSTGNEALNEAMETLKKALDEAREEQEEQKAWEEMEKAFKKTLDEEVVLKVRKASEEVVSQWNEREETLARFEARLHTAALDEEVITIVMKVIRMRVRWRRRRMIRNNRRVTVEMIFWGRKRKMMVYEGMRALKKALDEAQEEQEEQKAWEEMEKAFKDTFKDTLDEEVVLKVRKVSEEVVSELDEEEMLARFEARLYTAALDEWMITYLMKVIRMRVRWRRSNLRGMRRRSIILSRRSMMMRNDQI